LTDASRARPIIATSLRASTNFGKAVHQQIEATALRRKARTPAKSGRCPTRRAITPDRRSAAGAGWRNEGSMGAGGTRRPSTTTPACGLKGTNADGEFGKNNDQMNRRDEWSVPSRCGGVKVRPPRWSSHGRSGSGSGSASTEGAVSRARFRGAPPPVEVVTRHHPAASSYHERREAWESAVRRITNHERR